MIVNGTDLTAGLGLRVIKYSLSGVSAYDVEFIQASSGFGNYTKSISQKIQRLTVECVLNGAPAAAPFTGGGAYTPAAPILIPNGRTDSNRTNLLTKYHQLMRTLAPGRAEASIIQIANTILSGATTFSGYLVSGTDREELVVKAHSSSLFSCRLTLVFDGRISWSAANGANAISPFLITEPSP